MTIIPAPASLFNLTKKRKTTMVKKVIKPKTMWVVLKNSTLVSSFSTFAQAKIEAEETIEAYEHAEVKILEVVKAWEMIWPEEPSPEIWEIGLDTL